jgi:hypothetical protein
MGCEFTTRQEPRPTRRACILARPVQKFMPIPVPDRIKLLARTRGHGTSIRVISVLAGKNYTGGSKGFSRKGNQFQHSSGASRHRPSVPYSQRPLGSSRPAWFHFASLCLWRDAGRREPFPRGFGSKVLSCDSRTVRSRSRRRPLG